MKLIPELMELPGHVLGAITTIVVGSLTTGAALVAQMSGNLTEVVAGAPNWFFGFGAAVVLAMAWALLSLARYIVKLHKEQSSQLLVCIKDNTSAMQVVNTTLARQNMFWENAGIKMIQRAVDQDAELPCELPTVGGHGQSVLGGRVMRRPPGAGGG